MENYFVVGRLLEDGRLLFDDFDRNEDIKLKGDSWSYREQEPIPIGSSYTIDGERVGLYCIKVPEDFENAVSCLRGDGTGMLYMKNGSYSYITDEFLEEMIRTMRKVHDSGERLAEAGRARIDPNRPIRATA